MAKLSSLLLCALLSSTTPTALCLLGSAIKTALQNDFHPLLRPFNGSVGIQFGWRDFDQNPCSPVVWNFTYCQGEKIVGIDFEDSLSLGIAGSPLMPLPAELPQLNTFTSITVSGCTIQGSLPSEWNESLPNLQQLDLSSNFQLTGRLPKAWGSFSELTHLDLSGNHLSGTLPESWSALSKLEVLDLSHNNFSGTIPLSWSKLNLTKLDISSNQLTGGIQHFGAGGSWPSMTWVNASHNQFSGPLPKWEQSALHVLDVSVNALTGTLPAAWTQIDFAILIVGANQLQGKLLPLTEASWPHLYALVLADNAFTGTIPQQLTRLPLKWLYLENNRLSGPLPEWPADSPVTTICMGGNKFSGGLPESWGDLDQLFELRLEANSFTGSIPASWQRLNTTIMDLHSNKLSGSLPEEFIQGWVGTALLDISSNAYAGTISAAMLLCSLNASSNQLTGSLPNVSLLHGASLVVSHNQITGSVPYMLLWSDDYGRAAELDASYNQLAGSLPDVTVLVSSVSLQGNRLTGSIPVGWTRNGELDLSQNALTGQLPDPWQAFLSANANWPWDSINNLNLSHNFLTGPFFVPGSPEDVEYLTRPGAGVNPPFTWLTTLDLSSNSLTGSLTDAAVNSLVRLTHFNLSNNKLTGFLPFANPAAALAVNSYDGPIWAALSVLDLHNNSFQGALNPAWGLTGSDISLLNLADNLLTGSLPTQWAAGFWPFIEAVDLSRNHFNGSLPGAWGSAGGWRHVSSLKLGENAFTGAFPAAWDTSNGVFSNLTAMDISGNYLSGSLPQNGAFRAQMMLRPGNERVCGDIPSGFPDVVDLQSDSAPRLQACPSNALTAVEIAGIAIAGVVLASSIAGLLLWRKHKYDIVIRNYQRKLDGAGKMIERIDNWVPPERLASEKLGEDEDDMQDGWRIAPSRLKACRDANGQPIELGRGAYGVVYKALLDGSVEVACKTLFAEDVITTASSIDQFAIELGILQTCSHPNIVHVFGAWMSYDLAYIVSELCGQGNLSKALVREHSAMRWYGRGSQIAAEVADAIVYLTSLGIIHLDIKSDNILLTDEYQAKVCDVGISYVLRNQTRVQLSNARGTYDYMAPEVALGEMASTKADIYSFGWLLWEICTGEATVRGRTRRAKVPEECPAETGLLIEWCTKSVPEQRPTAKAVLQMLQTAREVGNAALQVEV